MVTRAEQKALTRSALIEAALRIIGSGANVASISLREVTKSAGLVPTSFYRHFDDMDELNLAVVDQLGRDLRRLLRGSVDAHARPDDVVRHLADVYVDYVAENAELVQFVNQARTAGAPRVRGAIDHELGFFVSRVAGTLPELVPGLGAADRDTVAHLVVSVLLESAAPLLAAAEDAAAREELRAALVRSLTVVELGAQQLGTAAAPKARKAAAPRARRTTKGAT
jgi:AcrR family transcriptional regulator